MPYLPELASLGPDVHTREFWDWCAKRELRFQRCAGCGKFRHPPRPGCPHCGAAEVEWIRATGRGRVFSFTIAHHAAFPTLAGAVPYNVVCVELDGIPGPRLVTNLVEGTPAIDMQVELVWDEPQPGVVLPRFRPA